MDLLDLGVVLRLSLLSSPWTKSRSVTWIKLCWQFCCLGRGAVDIGRLLGLSFSIGELGLYITMTSAQVLVPWALLPSSLSSLYVLAVISKL